MHACLCPRDRTRDLGPRPSQEGVLAMADALHANKTLTHLEMPFHFASDLYGDERDACNSAQFGFLRIAGFTTDDPRGKPPGGPQTMYDRMPADTARYDLPALAKLGDAMLVHPAMRVLVVNNKPNGMEETPTEMHMPWTTYGRGDSDYRAHATAARARDDPLGAELRVRCVPRPRVDRRAEGGIPDHQGECEGDAQPHPAGA